MSTQLPAGSAAAARRVTGSCGDFTPDGVKFRVVRRGNISFRIKTTFCPLWGVLSQKLKEIGCHGLRHWIDLVKIY